MAVSPLDIPGKILVRGLLIPNCKDFHHIVRRLVEKTQIKDILAALGMEKFTALQERIVFALSSGVDLYVTGQKCGGKTTAILVVILEHVFCELQKPKITEQDREAAPSSIIFCESTQKGLQLKSWLERFLQNLSPALSSLPKVTFLDNVHNGALLHSFTKQPIDILIMTGGALQGLLAEGAGALLDSLEIKFHRTRYIVFMEFGMKNFYFEKEAVDFLHEASDRSGLTVLERLAPNAQLIFSGTVWHNDCIGATRKALCELGRKSVMIFGSSLHALQFASSITWKMDHLTSEKAKLNTLIGICKGLLLEKRSVVVACSTSGVAHTVSKYISENGSICNNLITFGSQGGTSGVFKRNHDWMGSVFVVSDDALKDFEVYNASCLIHFDIDLPPGSKGNVNGDLPFCLERFSCLWMKMEREWRSTIEPPGLNHFFLSGNEPNFLALYKFLQVANIPLPQGLEEIAEQKLRNEVWSKPLCTNLKCFAYCNTVNCPDRHEISHEDLDIRADAPGYGELEFKVITSVNPSLYLVKLLNHFVFDENEQRVTAKAYREEARDRIMKMVDYYSIERNRIHPLKVTLGVLYGILYNRRRIRDGRHENVSSKNSIYIRTKLVGFIDEQCETSRKCDQGDYAQMLCIDYGTILTVALADLLVLPEQFRRWSPHCVEVVLSNSMYLEQTNEYYSDALEAAKVLSEGKVWYGKVLLSLRNTVWVDDMVHYAPNSVTGSLTEEGCNLLEELVRGRYATLQGNHQFMKVMLEYIRKRDPDFPEIGYKANSSSSTSGQQSYEEFHRKGDSVKWAQLPLTDLTSEVGEDGRDFSPVPFTIHAWISPWEIYGAVNERLEGDTRGVILLEQELTREMERFMAGTDRKKKCFNEFDGFLSVQSVVAVKATKRGGWQRGMIFRSHTNDNDTRKRCDVFLLDYGSVAFGLMEIKEVLPIRREYVEVMPFQAVCLKLSHVQPMGGINDWGSKTMVQISSVINKGVDVIAFAEVKSTGHPCNYYEAMAYEKTEGTTTIEIGLKLVEEKCAELTPSVEKILEMVRLVTVAHASRKCSINYGSEDEWSSSNEMDVQLCKDEDEEENDGRSETSEERFLRFCDVQVDGYEYVAILGGEKEGELSDDRRVGGNTGACSYGDRVGSEETMKRFFDAVCLQLGGLNVMSADNARKVDHKEESDFVSDDEDSDMFFDALGDTQEDD